MKILGFAGSLREDSYNKKIVKNSLKIAEKLGFEVEFLDLRDLEVPLYDADVQEAGFPKGAQKFKDMIRDSDAILISSPEYNRSVPGVLKNALDWASRPFGESAFKEKPVALITASNGFKGGARCMEHLVQVMESLGAVLTESHVKISEMRSKIDEDGRITEGEVIKNIRTLIQELIQISKN